MQIQVLTLFPEIFPGFLEAALIGKGIEKKLLSVSVTNFRSFSDLPHQQVDDSPYGGGAGMVLRPEPLSRAISDTKLKFPGTRVVALTPAGATFTQATAQRFAGLPSLCLVCGRYEGIDQRVLDGYIDEEISIGDYVLMGGEVAAMVVIEATARLLTGMVGNAASIVDESFSKALLEAPQYTRPAEFEGRSVPEVLLSGDHKKISIWRRERALALTEARRPDLLRRDSDSE